MKTRAAVFIAIVLLTGCRRPETAGLKAKAFGSAIVLVSGDKQIATVGSPVDQPLVVQVNDANGVAVPGARVSISVNAGAVAAPAEGLTGPDGQMSVTLALGGVAGRYQVVATTLDKGGKSAEVRIDEIALGYQQNLGRVLNDRYCSRCHDSESTAERVSNHDNLKASPHSFNDGAYLNRMSDADLSSIITHGGVAMNKSAEMPPYGGTLPQADIESLIAYIRAVSDPPYRLKGLVYAKN